MKIIKLQENTGLTLVNPWLLRVDQILSHDQIEAVKSRWPITSVSVREEKTFFDLGRNMGQTQLPMVAEWLGGW